MSIQSISHKHGNLIFERLPDDVIPIILKCLRGDSTLNAFGVPYPIKNFQCKAFFEAARITLDQERDILGISTICKHWKNHPILDLEKKHSQNRFIVLNQYERENFPKNLIRIFKQYELPIARLPILDLGANITPSGYIDWIEPNEMEDPITQKMVPIMRFTDITGRVGFAFCLTKKRDYNNTESSNQLSNSTLHLPLFGVTCLFQLYPREEGEDPNNKFWVYGRNLNGEWLHRTLTNETMPCQKTHERLGSCSYFPLTLLLEEEHDSKIGLPNYKPRTRSPLPPRLPFKSLMSQQDYRRQIVMISTLIILLAMIMTEVEKNGSLRGSWCRE